MLLEKKVAIITGGARGIGRAIAVRFAQEGCSTVIADLRDDDAAETLTQISRTGSEGLYARCDVSSREQARGMVDEIIRRFGRIDILVNDAAVSPPERSFLSITDEQWDRVLAVNLKGVFLCCQAVLPQMRSQKCGRIINVGSVGAVAPSKTIADYCVAKSGVLMLTQCLALEFAEDNICVNALLPGITRTDFHDAIRPSEIPKDQYFAGLARTIPLGRVADPEDIADVALFLASDLSRYVTGDRILVSGGLTR